MATHPHSASLRSLLEITRLLRAEPDVNTLLRAIASTAGSMLGYRTVAVNLYRRAWDDFEVAHVHGSERAREVLSGDTLDWAAWAPLLTPRFERRGAYFVPHGSFDWSADTGRRYVPELPVSSAPGAWHPEDELFAPMRHTGGRLLGVLSFSEPESGLRPGDAEMDVLAAVADHAAIALQSAEEESEATRHRVALAHLLAVSSRLAGAGSMEAVLEEICGGIRTALGFHKVSVEIPDPATGIFAPRAGIGLSGLELAGETGSLWALAPLFDPPFERHGCYLLTREQARARLPSTVNPVLSTRNGRGPWAWDDHWLLVPMRDRDGRMNGLVWVDEPDDRLLPTDASLQALRMFANQARNAIESAGRFQQMRFLAEHDPLTRLLNRRAFTRRLEAEMELCSQSDRRMALVVCDVDGLKRLNDRCGHAAGDEALQRTAAGLTGAIRQADAAFRIGGDEFAVILSDTDRTAAAAALARLARAVNSSAHPDAAMASFGCAVYPEDGRTPERLYRAADGDMYRHKRARDSAA